MPFIHFVDAEQDFCKMLSVLPIPLPPEVAKVKCAGSTVAGQANTFIFPEISAGNIGYKIAARLGEYEAIGPVLQGLNAPINDLSRGCNSQEVYKMALVTAALS